MSSQNGVSQQSMNLTVSGSENKDKRPRSTEPQHSQQSSPSLSPSRKKNHYSSQQNIHKDQTLNSMEGNVFYPQYMKGQHTHSSSLGNELAQQQQLTGERIPAVPSTPQVASQATYSSATLPAHSSSMGQGFVAQGYAGPPQSAASVSTFPANSMPTMQGILPQGGSFPQGVNREIQTFYQGNQMYNLPPQAMQGNGNYLVLSNSQGLPISAVNLEDVMTRLMAGVMCKLDSISSDLQQVAINKEATVQLNHEMVQVKKDIAGVNDSVQELQQKEEQASSRQQGIIQDLREIRERLDNPPPGETNKAPSPETQLVLLKLEANSRRNNLIIEGLAESETDPVPEDEAMETVKSFFLKTFDLKDMSIDSAYRMGKSRENSKFPRAILVKFLWPRERDAVWKARLTLANNKDLKVFIKEDLPPQLRAQLTALQKVSQVAKKYPNTYKNVQVRDFMIHVNGKSYSADQLEELPKRLRPSEFSTPGNGDAVVFYGRNSRFSNHYHSIFEWDNKSFSNMEQYLAYRRAKIAGRKDLANKAMNSNDPADSKRVLNELKAAPSEPEWIDSRHDILYSWLLAKFAQREDLMNYLLETENRQIGEASRDTTWGIGLILTDRNVLSPRHWRGQNLLGTTLMEVRQELSTPPLYEDLAPEGNHFRREDMPPGDK